jgi:signal transduction histidine kinase
LPNRSAISAEARTLLALVSPDNAELVGRWAAALANVGGIYETMGESGRRAMARETVGFMARLLRGETVGDDQLARYVDPPPYRDQPIGDFVMAGMLVDRELRDYLRERAPSPDVAAEAAAVFDPTMADAIARVVMLRDEKRGAAHLAGLVTEVLARAGDQREAFRRVAAHLADEFGADFAVIATVDEDSVTPYGASVPLEEVGFRAGEPVPRRDLDIVEVLERDQLHRLALTAQRGGAVARLAAAGYKKALLQPLHTQGGLVGVLALVYRGKAPARTRIREVLRRAAPILAAHLGLAREAGALRQAQAALGELFDVAPMMLCALDRYGRVVRTNHRFLEEMGLDHDVVHMPLAWLVHPDWLDRFTQHWERLRTGEPLEEARFDLITSHGERLAVACEAHWVAHEPGEASLCLMALSNVSVHVAQAAAQTKRIDELTAFAHHVAHDLKAPLRTIVSFSELLLDDLPPDAKTRAHAERVFAAAERGTTLVEGLLRFARGTSDAGASRPVALQELLEAVRNELAAELEQRGGEIVVTADEVPLLGQPVALSTLLTNLVGNAIRYTDGDAPRVEVAVRTTAPGWAALTVTDHGCGVPADEQGKIFDLFHRAHRDERGTGVGLAIVKRITAAHGGHVAVKSTPGEGSTFTVTLPTP